MQLHLETCRRAGTLGWLDQADPPGDPHSGAPGGSWERGDGSAQKLLAAFPAPAIPRLERILGGDLDLLPVHSLRHAKALLQSNAAGISLVACGVHFDESRMFDLLRFVRESHSRIPFVCCRVLETRVSRTFIEAAALSAMHLGAATFFDLPTRADAIGIEAAEQELRAVLLNGGLGPLRQ